jgi:Zn-dependent peptidase ImmA (M78 family)
MPDSQLREAFAGQSFLKLIQYKERFGISLAAMIYRAEKLKVINSTASRWLWTEMGKRGWRHNEPGYVWRDRAITFETMLESAIQTKQVTWGDAERVTGICEEELRKRLTDVVMVSSPTESADPKPATLKFTRSEESA